MKPKHPVIKFIEALHSAKELIATAYDSDEEIFVEPEDNKSQGLVASLSAMQMIIEFNADTFYLDTGFRRLIDKGLRQDTISYLNADIGEEITKLRYHYQQLQEASAKHNHTQRLKYLKELKHLFVAIAMQLNNTAEDLFMRTQMHFGKQDYFEDRLLENQFYQDELERLKASYYEVMKFLGDEQFKHAYDLHDMITTLNGRTLKFIDKVDQTLQYLRRYAYQLREHEVRTEKIRSLYAYIKANPTAQFERTAEQAYQQPFFVFPPEISLKTYPDMDNALLADQYQAWLENLRIAAGSMDTFKRVRSTATKAQQEQIRRQQNSADKFIVEVLRRCHSAAQPYSAHALLQMAVLNHADPEYAQLTKGYWLFYLLNVFRTKRRIGKHQVTRGFTLTPVSQVAAFYSGNVVIMDVVLASKAVSAIAIKQFIAQRYAT